MWNSITCNSHYEEFLKSKEAKRFHRSLNGIRPMVDTSCPKKVPHLKKRSKKVQLKEERKIEINFSNQKLMEKMIGIDNRTKPTDDMRINEENLKFLGRLQSAQPVLSSEKWEHDARHWLAVRNNIQKKSKKGSRPHSSREANNSDLISRILKRRSSRPQTALSSEYVG